MSDAALDTLVAKLRATAPPAPDALKTRVESIAAREAPEPRRLPLRDRIRPRRLLLVAAPATFAVMLGIAMAHGLSAGDQPNEPVGLAAGKLAPPTASLEVFGAATVPAANLQDTDTRRREPSGALRSVGGGATRQKAVPAPAKVRAQDYRASLTVRVADLDELSKATQAAIRATRAWGGYVVAADYDVPGTEGASQLELKVPVQHVQAAIQRFSELGTLAAQDIAIRDVQGTLNSYTRQLMTITERIAKLRADLAAPDLTDRERTRLELQLARSRNAAAELRAERAALRRTASFATVSLRLTTRDAAAVAPAPDGRVERILRDAGSILALELAFALYGLIVAAPVALLAAIAFFAARATRRRADDRLLGRV